MMTTFPPPIPRVRIDIALSILAAALLAFVITGAIVHTQSTGDVSATRVQQSAQRLDAALQAQHSHTTGATLTLTAPAGQFVYVTGLDISNCETATIVAATAPSYITTTGLNGSPQYQLGSGPATAPGAGVCSPVSVIAFATPLKSQTAGTAVTFVLPAFITNQVVSLNVYYTTGF